MVTGSAKNSASRRCATRHRASRRDRLLPSPTRPGARRRAHRPALSPRKRSGIAAAASRLVAPVAGTPAIGVPPPISSPAGSAIGPIATYLASRADQRQTRSAPSSRPAHRGRPRVAIVPGPGRRPGSRARAPPAGSRRFTPRPAARGTRRATRRTIRTIRRAFSTAASTLSRSPMMFGSVEQPRHVVGAECGGAIDLEPGISGAKAGTLAEDRKPRQPAWLISSTRRSNNTASSRVGKPYSLSRYRPCTGCPGARRQDAAVIGGQRPPPVRAGRNSCLFELDQRPAEILRVEKQHRLAVRAPSRLTVAKDPGALGA